MAYVSGPVLKNAATFGGYHVKSIISYIPVLTIWGVAGGAALATFTENWPLFQKTFYEKIPVIGNHWIKEVDPEAAQS
ncbi:ubiquinol--cytochrome-c reductase subunit 10 [Pichia kluyveri]|uniref:Ubiquinol--cytochrome-c reductase subunit 10 n=1 Tax=Pichia kluyveri TaxID=36015 RepID=A0AAV5R2U8_PICKL|nr:ubiquinol--cytochrome-c reductase subunit 10 [Pichia kluyveri]